MDDAPLSGPIKRLRHFKAAPQWVQNLRRGLTGVPQAGHRARAGGTADCSGAPGTGVPHRVQNLRPGFSGLPHAAHAAAGDTDAPGLCGGAARMEAPHCPQNCAIGGIRAPQAGQGLRVVFRPDPARPPACSAPQCPQNGAAGGSGLPQETQAAFMRARIVQADGGCNPSPPRPPSRCRRRSEPAGMAGRALAGFSLPGIRL